MIKLKSEQHWMEWFDINDENWYFKMFELDEKR